MGGMAEGSEIEVEEMPAWAAWVTERVYRDGGQFDRRRLVVVHAPTAAEARRESGVVEGEFRPPTEAELDAWHELTAEDLTVAELGKLERMVRSELIEVANKRVRARAFPGEQAHEERAHRSLGRAIRLALLRGKLLAWKDELDEERSERTEAA